MEKEERRGESVGVRGGRGGGDDVRSVVDGNGEAVRGRESGRDGRERERGEWEGADGGCVCVFAVDDGARESGVAEIGVDWEGTISVAVLANVSDAREVVSLAKLLKGDLEGDRDRVVITVVEDLPERAGARFPRHYLRNAPRRKCVEKLNARYVLVHDVDFEVFTTVPKSTFLADVRRVLTPGARRALVIPGV